MRIIVTGASSGIGKETALALSAQGNQLFLTARRRERLEQVSRECLARGADRAEMGCHDLSLVGEGQLVVEDALERLGGLDVLICNAGYGVYGPVQEIEPREMARIWQVNFQSGFESIHAALPHFLRQASGHVVLVSSVIGKVALPMGGAYCATKFAQAGLAEALWGELRGSGVDVSLICPGYTRTEFMKAAVVSRSAAMFRRVGGDSPEQVARSIVQALERRKRLSVLTLPGKLTYAFNRFFPNTTAYLIAWLVGKSSPSKPRH